MPQGARARGPGIVWHRLACRGLPRGLAMSRASTGLAQAAGGPLPTTSACRVCAREALHLQ